MHAHFAFWLSFNEKTNNKPFPCLCNIFFPLFFLLAKTELWRLWIYVPKDILADFFLSFFFPPKQTNVESQWSLTFVKNSAFQIPHLHLLTFCSLKQGLILFLSLFIWILFYFISFLKMTVSCCVNLPSWVANISSQLPRLKLWSRGVMRPSVTSKGCCSLEWDQVKVVTKNVHNTRGTDMCLTSLVSSCLSIYYKTQKEIKAV